MIRRSHTHMDRHLNACFRPRTFEDDVEPVLLVKLRQCGLGTLLCAAELVFGGFGLVYNREAEHLLSEPIGLGKVEAGLINIDRDDARGTHRFREGAGKDTDCANAEDEHSLTSSEVGASRSVDEDR